MRTLYHFQFSPFSRRTRLALARGLELPRALLAWADAHRDRAEVRALASRVG